MKIHYRHWKLLALTIMIFMISIGYVLAASIVPIGYTGQATPFESGAAGKITGSRTITNEARGYDRDTDTVFKMSLSAGFWGVTGFDRPSDWGLTDFAIGWVDIKVKYMSPGTVDDYYRIEYTVGTAPWVAGNLQPDVSGVPAARYPTSAETLATVWHNVAELETPGDGWTWNDLSTLQVRFLTTPTGTVDSSLSYYVNVYEIWVTVYPLPLPPATSTAISIQPTVIPTLPYEDNPDTDPAENLFFVDVYVKDVTALQGWQIILQFNTTVLSAVQGMVYAPFTDVAWIDLETPNPGEVNIASSIHTDSPLIDSGWSGSTPLGRIYFTVDAPGYSWLIPTKTKVSAPGPVPIAHSQYPGVYGTPPEGLHLMSGGTDITAPISTEWTEIHPVFGKPWHITDWMDNGDEYLSVSDTIAMTPIPSGPVQMFHVASFYESDLGVGIKHYMDVMEITAVPEFPLGLGILMAMAPVIAIAYIWRQRKRSR